MKKILAVLLALVFCLSFSVSALSAEMEGGIIVLGFGIHKGEIMGLERKSSQVRVSTDYPLDLSGGQRQRVAMGRALVGGMGEAVEKTGGAIAFIYQTRGIITDGISNGILVEKPAVFPQNEDGVIVLSGALAEEENPTTGGAPVLGVVAVEKTVLKLAK